MTFSSEIMPSYPWQARPCLPRGNDREKLAKVAKVQRCRCTCRGGAAIRWRGSLIGGASSLGAATMHWEGVHVCMGPWVHGSSSDWLRGGCDQKQRACSNSSNFLFLSCPFSSIPLLFYNTRPQDFIYLSLPHNPSNAPDHPSWLTASSSAMRPSEFFLTPTALQLEERPS